jgi:hypothetical protein
MIDHENTPDGLAARRPPPRLQFGLSALFLLTFVVAVLSGWLKVFGPDGIRVPIEAAVAITFGIVTLAGPMLTFAIVCLWGRSTLRRLPAAALVALAVYVLAGTPIATALMLSPQERAEIGDFACIFAATMIWWSAQFLFIGLVYRYWGWQKSREKRPTRALPSKVSVPPDDEQGDP